MADTALTRYADRWLGRLFPPRFRPGAAERRHGRVGRPDLWRMKRAFQIDFLIRMGLDAHHRLLDLGCGTLRGGLPVIEHLAAGSYTGVDVSAALIEEARGELIEAGLIGKEPQLLVVEDLASLELGCGFDFVWAFSMLAHLDDGQLDEALVCAARHLRPDGVFYANVNLGDGSLGSWQGFPIVARPLDFYIARAADAGLVVDPVGRLRELGHVSGDAVSDAQLMLRMRPAR